MNLYSGFSVKLNLETYLYIYVMKLGMSMHNSSTYIFSYYYIMHFNLGYFFKFFVFICYLKILPRQISCCKIY